MQVVFDLKWRDSSAECEGSHGVEAAAATVPDEVELPATAPIRAIPINADIAARALGGAGVIAVPTDTLYGAQQLRRHGLRCVSTAAHSGDLIGCH